MARCQEIGGAPANATRQKRCCCSVTTQSVVDGYLYAPQFTAHHCVHLMAQLLYGRGFHVETGTSSHFWYTIKIKDRDDVKYYTEDQMRNPANYNATTASVAAA